MTIDTIITKAIGDREENKILHRREEVKIFFHPEILDHHLLENHHQDQELVHPRGTTALITVKLEAMGHGLEAEVKAEKAMEDELAK